MLKEFMNCFPLQEFWRHVLIIRTHVLNKNLKKHRQLEKGIIDKLGHYMDDKKIFYQKDLNDREFHFNSVNDDNDSINVNDNIKVATNLTSTMSTPNFIHASALLNEFNFYFTKELDRCFRSLNLALCDQKYFVGTNQYSNLIKFLTTHNFSSYQQNFDFT